MINKNSNKLNKKSFNPNNQTIINYKNPATKSFPQTIASENNEDFYEMTFKFQKNNDDIRKCYQNDRNKT